MKGKWRFHESGSIVSDKSRTRGAPPRITRASGDGAWDGQVGFIKQHGEKSGELARQRQDNLQHPPPSPSRGAGAWPPVSSFLQFCSHDQLRQLRIRVMVPLQRSISVVGEPTKGRWLGSGPAGILWLSLKANHTRAFVCRRSDPWGGGAGGRQQSAALGAIDLALGDSCQSSASPQLERQNQEGPWREDRDAAEGGGGWGGGQGVRQPQPIELAWKMAVAAETRMKRPRRRYA